jgi:hypothetical protein
MLDLPNLLTKSDAEGYTLCPLCHARRLHLLRREWRFDEQPPCVACAEPEAAAVAPVPCIEVAPPPAVAQSPKPATVGNVFDAVAALIRRFARSAR